MGVGAGWDLLSKLCIDVGHLLSCICWQPDSWIFLMHHHAFGCWKWRRKEKEGEVVLNCVPDLELPPRLLY